jgi:hypothetical protein
MQRKKRLIRITENQLKEAETFNFLNGTSEPHCDGQRAISADGRLDDDDYGQPETTDDIADTVSPQAYLRYFDKIYGGNGIRRIWESDEDKNGDGADDFTQKPDKDLLNDNDFNNDIVRIPPMVFHKLNLFLEEVAKHNLTERKKYIILSHILKVLGLHNLPPSYQRDLRNTIH